MKVPLSILYDARKKLVDNVKYHTNQAESWSTTAQDHKRKASSFTRDAARAEQNCQEACVNRNHAQASLNEIDAAIYKLEHE